MSDQRKWSGFRAAGAIAAVMVIIGFVLLLTGNRSWSTPLIMVGSAASIIVSLAEQRRRKKA